MLYITTPPRKTMIALRDTKIATNFFLKKEAEVAFARFGNILRDQITHL